MVENPYFHRTPIRDSRFFFGRTAETRKILSCVSMGQSVSIVGPRRIGISSLLFHLSDPQVRAAHGLGDDCIFVYIDCQALSNDLTKYDVYRELLEDIIEATPGDPSTEYSSRESITYLDFKKRLDEFIAPGLQIVFLFDEFDSLADNRQLGKDFFTELRGLGQTGKVVYVTASGETLYELSFHDENILSSHFFNIFYAVWLGFMRPQEARAMVDGLAAMADFEGFDENDHAFLRAIAGPHPFYLQVACYLLFEEKTGVADSAAPNYDRVRRQFAREMRGHFQYTWNHLSDDERRVLRLISKGCLDETNGEDKERLDQKSLVYQGKIFSSAFAEFVRRQVTKAEVREACEVKTRNDRQATTTREVNESDYRVQIDRLVDQITRMIDLLDRHKDIEGVVKIRKRLRDELVTLGTNRTQLIELEASLSPENPMRADAFRRLTKDVQRIKYYVRFEIGPRLRELGIPIDIGDSPAH